jgi:DNA repair exonuclease SbcCD ATPase subunit
VTAPWIDKHTARGLALFALLAIAPISVRAQTPAAAEATPRASGSLDRVLDERIEVDEAARASQQRIEKLDDETQKLLTEYRKALSDTESYTRYADQLRAQVASQTEEMTAIEMQLREVETTSREVAPLMQKMLATLAQFVELDVPFLVEERSRRVATLQEMMPRADVTFSEKYRRILEAYQVEMEYGRTIEAYEAKLGSDAKARTVQFLRVGRVALLYQTLDGAETGYWDAQQKQWVPDDHYSHAFKEGVAVAKKVSAPELLRIPVRAPKESAS